MAFKIIIRPNCENPKPNNTLWCTGWIGAVLVGVSCLFGFPSCTEQSNNTPEPFAPQPIVVATPTPVPTPVATPIPTPEPTLTPAPEPETTYNPPPATPVVEETTVTVVETPIPVIDLDDVDPVGPPCEYINEETTVPVIATPTTETTSTPIMIPVPTPETSYSAPVVVIEFPTPTPTPTPVATPAVERFTTPTKVTKRPKTPVHKFKPAPKPTVSRHYSSRSKADELHAATQCYNYWVEVYSHMSQFHSRKELNAAREQVEFWSNRVNELKAK